MVRHEVFVGLIYRVLQAVGHECLFIFRSVFIKVYLFIFGFAYHLGTEFQFVSVPEGEFEVHGEFQVFFLDVFLLFGEFLQAEIFVQCHCRTGLWCSQRFVFVAQIHVELLFLQLEINVTFVRTLLCCFGVTGIPIHRHRSEQMLASQCEVHRALAFQAGVAIVRRTGFSLYAYSCFSLFIHIFQSSAVSVLPVVPVIENSFKHQFVVFADIPVQGCRIALAFTGYIVLAYLVVVDIYVSFVVFLPKKLGIVGTRWGILIGSR
ncbi:unknown [Bacteroides fragilis CAG:47]|nr:unknown [Bacteroides fragilis CAG:47]